MKRILRNLAGLTLIVVLLIPGLNSFAGNKQRAGSSGAPELLINPWGRSSGWGGANVANVKGLEALYINVAGASLVNKTELIFSRTTYVADISINAFGLAQKIGDSGVLGLAIMSMDCGEFIKTTNERPDGGLGTFNPKYTNISVSYSKVFSNQILGGVAFKIISGGIADVTTSGIAIDAGIQYVAGDNNQIHFGITMKNVGPTMKYTGDGLSVRGVIPPTDISMTIEHRKDEIELPSLLKIGLAYDFYLGATQRLTAAGSFTAFSFQKDKFHLGLEYSFREILLLRCGFIYEDGINPLSFISDKYDDFDTRTDFFTGPSAGVSIQIPMNKESGSVFAIDYSYRDTNPFQGVHTIGARITL
ncbi:PorV/PorQ family protein [Bacteroidota bacterium]